MVNFVSMVLGLIILVIIVSSVALPIIHNTNTTLFTSTELSIFQNVGVMLVLGLFVTAAALSLRG